ncbi:MAG: hypothetical protein Q4A28_01870 [Brachymonas sp.]|nr:hypothetical protein [Brachymonas sp.]
MHQAVAKINIPANGREACKEIARQLAMRRRTWQPPRLCLSSAAPTSRRRKRHFMGIDENSPRIEAKRHPIAADKEEAKEEWLLAFDGLCQLQPGLKACSRPNARRRDKSRNGMSGAHLRDMHKTIDTIGKATNHPLQHSSAQREARKGSSLSEPVQNLNVRQLEVERYGMQNPHLCMWAVHSLCHGQGLQRSRPPTSVFKLPR